MCYAYLFLVLLFILPLLPPCVRGSTVPGGMGVGVNPSLNSIFAPGRGFSYGDAHPLRVLGTHPEEPRRPLRRHVSLRQDLGSCRSLPDCSADLESACSGFGPHVVTSCPIGSGSPPQPPHNASTPDRVFIARPRLVRLDDLRGGSTGRTSVRLKYSPESTLMIITWLKKGLYPEWCF